MPKRTKTLEEIQSKADLCQKRGEFYKKYPLEYAAAKKRDDFEQIVSHMHPSAGRTIPLEEIQLEASKYQKRNDFRKRSPTYYAAAWKRDDFDKICSHMPPAKNLPYADGEIESIINKYVALIDFIKNDTAAYLYISRRSDFYDLCGHLIRSKRDAYTDEELEIEAKRYQKRSDLEKNNAGAYKAVLKRGPEFMDRIFAHTKPPSNMPYTLEEIKDAIKKCSSRGELHNKYPSIYNIAYKRGDYEDLCSNMPFSKRFSVPEREILDAVKSIYKNTIKIRDMKVSISDKPYIYGFEIDVYVPELKRGIEFDGTRYHSFEFMRNDSHKSKWSDEDVRNYHQLKDDWFASKGIKILHIKEEDWVLNKEDCIRRCLSFLSQK